MRRFHFRYYSVAVIILIPLGKTNMLGQLHTVPFTAQEACPFLRKLSVPAYAVCGPVAIYVSHGPALSGIMVVFACVQMHFQQIHSCHGRIMDHAVIGL